MPPSYLLRNVDRLQHVAVSRLTIYTAGRVHALLLPFQVWLAEAVRGTADRDGYADPGALAVLVNQADPRWRNVVREYVQLLTAARRAAGDIAFRPWLMKHNHFFPRTVERIQETFTPSADDYHRLAEMWLRRRAYALNVAQARIYGDGLNLSSRIWRLEQGGMQTIRSTLAGAMTERTNAWDLARRLEGRLNADREWPKWSEQRLRGMDARARAASKQGLWRNAADMRRQNPDLTGTLTPPGGISYNALRLARNEIQAANHAVTSDIAQNFPGIVGRNVVLSPAHPRLDVCDTAVAENPHPKTANFLPLHSQCMCRWEEVLMPRADFTRQATGWSRGENGFLDGYAAWLGWRSFAPVDVGAAAMAELLRAVDVWLSGDVDAMATVLDLGR